MRHIVAIHHPENVHIAAMNSHSLCGLLALYKNIDGENVLQVADTKRPTTCQACRKAIEMLVRRKLVNLPASELERIYEENQ